MSVKPLALFPNPAVNEVMVEMPAGAKVEMVLYDVRGREVLRRQIAANDRVAIGHLPEGHYTVVFNDADGTSHPNQRLTIAR